MNLAIIASEIPTTIQSLLDQRHQHVEAISKIDHTLAAVTVALGSYGVASPAPAKASLVPVAKKAPAAKKRSRGSFAVSATDLVLEFLKSNKGATTKAITEYVVAKGRSTGSVSNALSVLSKAKKLKRTPLGKGKLGSTYSLA
jgi:hypothetical protein